jgi:hypothetical protein
MAGAGTVFYFPVTAADSILVVTGSAPFYLLAEFVKLLFGIPVKFAHPLFDNFAGFFAGCGRCEYAYGQAQNRPDYQTRDEFFSCVVAHCYFSFLLNNLFINDKPWLMPRKTDPILASGTKTSSCAWSAISPILNAAWFIADMKEFNRLYKMLTSTHRYTAVTDAIKPQATNTRSRKDASSNKLPPVKLFSLRKPRADLIMFI